VYCSFALKGDRYLPAAQFWINVAVIMRLR